MEEILGSIPDVRREFENHYPDALPYTIPVEIVRRRQAALERILPSHVAKYPSPKDALDRVVGFSRAYLAPQYGEQLDYIVLYPRKAASALGTYSILGQRYLQVAHVKQRQHLSPNQLILMCMGLFVLGYLSRYHPEVWNPFVRSDATGERLVIEKFVAICHRFLPNLVLNAIDGARIQFVYETDRVLDLTASLTASDVKDILEEMKKRGQL